jgi:hypothetical protein
MNADGMANFVPRALMFDTEGSAKAQEEKIGGAVREKWIETNLICRRLETIPEGFIAIRDRERPKKGGIGEKISPVVGSRQCFIRGKRDAKGGWERLAT